MNCDNSKSNGHRSVSDELAWQCDQLLLGEMSPEQSDQLLEQLADDQHARETLAGEVLLLQSLTLLEAADFAAPVQPASHTTADAREPAPAWTRSVTWLASVALACCLLIAATVAQPWDWSGNTTKTNEIAEKHASLNELASYWSENQELYESLALVDVNTEFPPRERDHDAEELAPAWMFAAVEAESGERLPSEGMGEENEQWQ